MCERHVRVSAEVPALPFVNRITFRTDNKFNMLPATLIGAPGFWARHFNTSNRESVGNDGSCQEERCYRPSSDHRLYEKLSLLPEKGTCRLERVKSKGGRKYKRNEGSTSRTRKSHNLTNRLHRSPDIRRQRRSGNICGRLRMRKRRRLTGIISLKLFPSFHLHCRDLMSPDVVDSGNRWAAVHLASPVCACLWIVSSGWLDDQRRQR